MLEPREADIPILFLVLVVLPLVAYFLLGKWSEVTKKREKVNLLAELAAEEAIKAEGMATASVIPPGQTFFEKQVPHYVPTSKNVIRACARCFSTATTRCSKCKCVTYCSGRCQIIHWRQVHKQECQQLESIISLSSSEANSIAGTISENIPVDGRSPYFRHDRNHFVMDNAHVASAARNILAPDTSEELMARRKSADRRVLRRASRESLRRRAASFDFSDETSGSRPINFAPLHNLSNTCIDGQDIGGAMYQKEARQQENINGSRSKYESLGSLHAGKNGMNAHESQMEFVEGGGNPPDINPEMAELSHPYENAMDKKALHRTGNQNYKSSKLMMKACGEQSDLEKEGTGEVEDDSKVTGMRNSIPSSGSKGVASLNIMKMMGLRKSPKFSKQDLAEHRDINKNSRMLFPYEEFVKIFTYDTIDLSLRGLLNCGNSCYANAVLQCLTCTKPLINFLLRRSHSKACRRKDWCLICELEQHVTMLRESGGPLSPSRILTRMRKINCQIGDGNQEDAHEFLRILVASMQSICLEGLGGEEKVDHRLQETTFIQHAFGGRLRSKVKCLRCNHESERFENIMDLTLEIFGWVESLEDALTQFTTPEELDGENMYRCGRCSIYVQARKQLRIHEAPNILTIVLKRFQEGRYGKINKCITFPDMLDMVPYMTGMGDNPPLYILYGVVVHLDTLNASFSGHYVAYVKDLRGCWFRIDDTEVHPVSITQVMSEEAYILFYIRSCPRQQRAFDEKAITQQLPPRGAQCASRSQKSSRHGQSRSSSHFVSSDPSSSLNPENVAGPANHFNGILRSTVNRNIAQMEVSDAASSDWSIFTSSDDASFTTDSTRDSFSTVDYNDGGNNDMFSSIFNNLYGPDSSMRNTVWSTRFSNSKPQTQFISEERGYVLESYLSGQPRNKAHKRDNHVQARDASSKSNLDVLHWTSPDCRHSTCSSIVN